MTVRGQDGIVERALHARRRAALPGRLAAASRRCGCLRSGRAESARPASAACWGVRANVCDAAPRPAGNLFESPSAFSVYLKRQTNPDRKADDGWKTVRYRGM